ncbi:hypothetical protein [Ornithinimicrobium kibberense]
MASRARSGRRESSRSVPGHRSSVRPTTYRASRSSPTACSTGATSTP